MPSIVYPYTVSNSYKGGLFMRTYNRNVRRAWDGDDHRPPKRIRLDNETAAGYQQSSHPNKENSTFPIDIDIEDNLERLVRETSVAALSSSPSRKNSTIFSLESHDDDNGSATITPPSSPPPQLQLTPPNVKPRKPTFSILEKKKKEKEKEKEKEKSKVQSLQPAKRKLDALTSVTEKRDASEPLAEIRNSSRASSTAPPHPASSNRQSLGNGTIDNPQTTVPARTPIFPNLNKADQAKPLTQTVIDFGQALQPITCPSPDCAMTYTPTQPDDVALHTLYHGRHSQGIDLGKPFLKSAMKWGYESPLIPGSVVVVDRKISLPGRRVVSKVLEVVNRELGSVDIPEEELWSQREVPGEKSGDGKKCDRYKAFLHIINGKCVAIVLAERIAKAYKVVPAGREESEKRLEVQGADDMNATPKAQKSQENRSSNSISQESYPAIVGVSRIWTSRNFRRKGIANNLLECVMNQFIYGMDIDKSDVAISQPTEMGTALANRWHGGDESERGGWKVYIEE